MGVFDMNFKDVEDGGIGLFTGTKKKTAVPAAPDPMQPAAQPAQAIAAPAAMPSISLGASPPPTIHNNGGLPADVVQRGIETMRSQLATPAAVAPAVQPAAPAQAIANVATPNANRPWYAGTDSRDERTGLEMEKARRVEATQAGVLNDPVKSAIQFGVVGSPAPAPTTIAPSPVMAPNTLQSPQKFSAQSAMTQLPDSGISFMTGAEPGKAPTPYAKPGFNAGGVITAESAQAAMGADMQRSGGIAGTMDLAAANAVDQRANNVRQQMIDSQVGGGTGKPVSWQDQHGNADPEKQRIADSNALLNKWDKQYQNGQVMAEMGRNPRAAQSIAHLAAAAGHDEALSRGQDIAAGTHANEDMTKRRGQDVIANSEAAKLAGSPQDQQLKQAKAQGIMAGLENNKMIDDIRKKAIAGDAQSLAVYQSLTGKAKPATDRYMTVVGGEEVGPDGMTKIKKPSGVFDAQSGKFVPMNGGQQGQQAQAPASAVEYLKKNPSQAAAFKSKYGYTPEGF